MGEQKSRGIERQKEKEKEREREGEREKGGHKEKTAMRFVIPSPFLAFLMTFWRFPATFRHLLATISHKFIQLVKCEYIEL